MKYIQLSKFICLVVFSIGFYTIEGQNLNLAEYQAKYKGESEVIISETSKYVIKSKKGELDIVRDLYFESLILDQNGIGNYTESFYTSDFTPVIKHDAFTINSKNKKIKTDLITSKSNTDASIFFDDVKEMNITYQGLEPGARKVLKTQTKFLDPNLLHKFIFQKSSCAREVKFEIEVDNDVEIGYRIFNEENADINFTKENKRKKKIYTWVSKDLDKYKYELSRPGLLHTAPHLIFYIESVTNDNIKTEMLGDVDKLVKYYSGFVNDLNKEISPELSKIASLLVADITDEEEKVKTIYYWVKDNIKYIAYENGYEGFIPREASLVCSRKFGDCKDMSSIITAMCQSVGIKSVKLAWIGTRDIPYTYEQAPTPAADNHMIAAYDKGNEIIFLDATDSETMYGLPSGFIQGKEAIVYDRDGSYKVATVPIVPAEKNLVTYDINAALDNGVLKGDGQLTFNGLERSKNIARLSGTNEKKRFNTVKSRVLLGSNKFSLEDYSEKHLSDKDLPFIIDFKYNLDNYVVTLENETYINLFLKEITLINEFEENREHDFEFSHLLDYVVNVDLSIPSSSSVSDLAEGFMIDNEVLYFNSEFHKTTDKVSLHYEVKIKDLFIRKKNFDLWDETVKKIKRYMKNTITITSKT